MNDFPKYYNEPVTGSIARQDGKSLGEQFRPYLVEPARLNKNLVYDTWRLGQPIIKLIDFGQAFYADKPVDKVTTPLSMRAPEITFNEQISQKVDLWSVGCLVSSYRHGPLQHVQDQANILPNASS